MYSNRSHIASLLAVVCAVLLGMEGGGMTLGKIGSRSMFGWRNPYVTDGLVAHYDGEWNAGGGVHVPSGLVAWRDLSETGLDLAMPAASAFELGEKCIRFNGTGAAESVASTIVQASLHGTFELVVQRSKLGTGSTRVFFSCGNSAWWRAYASISGGPLGVYAYNSGYEGFRWYSMANLETVQSPISFAFMFDKDGASWKSVVKSYANGRNFSFFTFPNNYGYKADMPTSGVVSAGTTNSTDGLTSIFSVRVYDRHLTADEIAANYAVDRARFNLP